MRTKTPPGTTASALPTIDSAALAGVTGGRLSIRKGPDPKVLLGLKQLGEAIAVVGQQMTAQKQASSQQMMGMMQQMMQKR
ncbi:MAG: hypothetical protein WKG01_12720 [Kofleriaceae bacterium]